MIEADYCGNLLLGDSQRLADQLAVINQVTGILALYMKATGIDEIQCFPDNILFETAIPCFSMILTEVQKLLENSQGLESYFSYPTGLGIQGHNRWHSQ